MFQSCVENNAETKNTTQKCRIQHKFAYEKVASQINVRILEIKFKIPLLLVILVKVTKSTPKK